MTALQRTLFLPCLLLFLQLPAQDHTSFPNETPQQAAPQDTTAALDLAQREEGSWVGIKGTIEMVGSSSFFLNYGDSSVIVTLSGPEFHEHSFRRGQNVTVYGKMDEDLFERNMIKAKAVVIPGESGTEHTVVGEEDQVKVITASPVSGSVVHGVVSEVTDGAIVIDQGNERISIDTTELSSDPSVENGVTVEEGDLVTAQGVMRRDFWEGRSMKATALDVITMDELNNVSDSDTEAAGSEQAPDENE